MSICIRDAAGNVVKAAGLGPPGPAGKSAYQYAVDGGYTGTEEEFAALLGQQSNPNLLINSRWDSRESIINQKGQGVYQSASSSGELYGIDQWLLCNFTKLTLVDDGFTLDYPGNAGGTYIMIQPVENFQALRGKTLTLSLLVSSISAGARIDIGAQFQANYAGNIGSSVMDAPGLLSLTFTVPEDAALLNVFIESPQYLPATLKPEAMKLELGSVQTLVRQDADGSWVLNDPPPDKATELLKCQRYQKLIPIHYKARMIDYSGSQMRFSVELAVPMRAMPTITNGTFVVRSLDMITVIRDFSFIVEEFNDNYVTIVARKTNHGMTDGYIWVENGFVILDSNL